MESKSLMIGDWVLLVDGPARVLSISQDGIYFEDNFGESICPFDKIQPIPLTAEILEKNGFGFTPAPSERVWMRNGQEVWLDNEGKNYWANLKRGECYFEGYVEYIHELQHALRLCGIEKEIEL